MRRTTSLVLVAALALGPGLARADDEDEDRPAKKIDKKHKKAAAKEESEDEEEKPAKKKKAAAKEEKEESDDQDEKVEKKHKKVAKEDAEDEEEPEEEAKPIEVPAFLTTFPPRRATYIIGGAFLVGGLAFAFSAQGEAKRTETITSAVEAQNALVNARASAATASVFYGLAAATLAYALMLEFLPEPVAEKASLTFHF
jgi:flagellar biosynthesis GTPase FlhF